MSNDNQQPTPEQVEAELEHRRAIFQEEANEYE